MDPVVFQAIGMVVIAALMLMVLIVKVLSLIFGWWE